jgi:hypothetical protein
LLSIAGPTILVEILSFEYYRPSDLLSYTHVSVEGIIRTMTAVMHSFDF